MYQEHLNDLVKERPGDMKASEKRCAAALESIADAVIVTDETGHIVFMNTTAEMITGQPVKECLHKQLSEVFDIISGVNHQHLDDLAARVLRDGVVAEYVNTILVRKDGSEIPIDGNCSRIQQEDGTLSGVVLVFRDITKRKQADEALRNQAALLNFAHDAIFVFDAEDTITFWNRGAVDTYGWTLEEAVGRVTHALLKTRFPMPLLEIKQEAEKNGEWNGELIHTRKDGDEIVVASRWAVQWDIWGRHVATLEINRDITERKKAEEALRKSRAEALQKRFELETVIRSVPLGLVLYNKDGSARESNEAYKKIMSYSDREIRLPIAERTSNRQFFDEAGVLIEGHRLPFYRVLEEKSVHNQIIRFTADGSEHWVSINAAPIIFDGELTGVVGGFVDITEVKRAELALRESERNLEQAQRIAHVGSWIWKVETGELNCSAESFRIYGEEPFSFKPTIPIFLTYVHPEDLEYIKSTIDDFQSGRIKKIDQEFRIVRKDQSVRYIHSIVETMESDSAGKPHLLRGTGQDITKRKMAEIDLQYRTEELAAANRDLESFSYSVSHDLRNPLRTIGGFADFLMEDYADRLDEEGQDYIRRINSGVKKMQALIDDMLSLSRIGRQEMKREKVDLCTMVRSYIEELKSNEPQRQVELVIENKVQADADPRLIRLALENMLRNAWKFTSKKEVTRIEFGTATLTSLGDRLQGPRASGDRCPSGIENQTVYFVKDNGAGFDAKFAEKIFEPFKRVHAEKEFSGTGVGLSIVQRVIGRHGGKVWAEGEVGKGATFYFTLG